jgi:eukaryotic-like serine/threonine-protein kinase
MFCSLHPSSLPTGVFVESQRIGQYELREVLGEGKDAVVYKAWDLEVSRWVALKVFDTPPDIDWERASILTSCNHPHVAAFYEAGEDGGRAFVAMEHMPGGTLRDQIHSHNSVGNPFALNEILEYGTRIADGLAYLHSHGIHHGNLKSTNVFVAGDGSLKIGDFSFLHGPRNSLRMDLHGLALLLHEMATGEVSLLALDDETDVAAMPEMVLQSLSRLRPDLPGAFSDIVRRILDGAEARDVVSDFQALDAGPVPAGVVYRSEQSAVSKGAGSHLLASEQVLAGRFKIIRFLGRGGMGEVYAAEDRELGEPVALKTVRPEIASDERVISRFRKEIQLARKVTHRNVCRIYDLFHHLEEGAGSNQKITFLTMELLSGETLAERLRRDGPIPTSAAHPLVLQMSAALDAAHKAGIVHGDFKTSNVMLVASDDDETPRVVVTDFGLARTSGAENSVTLGAEVIGTPAYMAPELLEGGVTTPAVDIYALGVVAFEMLTGKLPFTGPSILSLALDRLQHEAPSPRTFVPDLDQNWETTILRCLDRNPTKRFQSIADVPEALGGTAPIPAIAKTDQPRPGRRIERKRWTRLKTGAAVAVTLIIAVAFVALYFYGQRERAPTRRSVAVLGFTNLTGRPDAEWLSTGLSEMLNTELAAGEQLRTIPGETVARMKVELALTDSGGFAKDTLMKIRNYLDADFIVYGAYVMFNDVTDKIRLDLRLQDASNGKVLATMTEGGSTSETLELVSRAGAQLRQELGLPPLSPSEFDAVRASTPTGSEAVRLYSLGVRKLQVFDAFGARESLEKAAAVDPKNALARSALATTWSMLGFPRRAAEEAEAALQLSANLPREGKLLVEGRHHEALLDWKRASEVYTTLFQLFPDNLDYGLRLASAQVSAGNPNAAANTIKKLRQFPAPENDNPRIDVVQARLAGATSDFKMQQALAAKAVTKGRSLGTRLLVAGARLLEGSALVGLGNLEEARSAFEEARTMYIAAGDRWDSANAATNLALALAQSGDLQGAKTALEDSLMIYREVGDQKGAAAAHVNLGTVLRNEARFDEARTAYNQALDIYQQTGDQSGEGRALNNLANLAAASGDSAGARKLLQKALPVVRQSGDLDATATVLVNLAELFADQGDLANAGRSYDESLAIFRQNNNKNSIAHTLDRIADLLVAKGDFAGARQKYEESLALRKQTGVSATYTQVGFANLLLTAQNSPAEAEQIAAAAAGEFQKEGRTEEEASALAVVARAMFAQNKFEELKAPLDRALRLSGQSNRGVRLSVGIAAASIFAGMGRQPEAIEQLNRVVEESRRAGLVGLEFEARLALGEVEVQAGRRAQGLARLRSVEDAARGQGYLNVANKAAAARLRFRTPS